MAIVRDLIWALGFKVDTKPIQKAERAIKDLGDEARTSESKLGRISSTIQGIAAGLNIFDRLAQGGRFLLDTIKGFEQLRAQLVTIEQDEQKAEAAFQRIQNFATRTPFQLQNVTQAFAKLRALGLQPTDEDLEGLGNTAAAWGKDITEFAQAVTGAVTGEMDMLKNFGIVAKQEGDKVEFLFDGQRKTVKKNAKDISDFLFNLGKTRFAGAMERQMGTINGAISNLMDNVSKFADRVGKFGLAREINLFARELTGAVGEGDDLAETLGKGLASAVRMLRDLFKFARQNVDLLALGLKVVAGAAILEQVLKLVSAFRQLALMIGIGSLPLLAVILVLGGMFLILTDLFGLIEGKNSVMGDLFMWFGLTKEEAQTLAAVLLGLASVFMLLFSLITGAFVPIALVAIVFFWDEVVAFFKGGIDELLDLMSSFKDWLLEGLTGALDAFRSAWEDFWGNGLLGQIAQTGLKNAITGISPLLGGALELATTGSPTPSTPGLIGGGAADPAVDAQRRIAQTENNQRKIDVNAGGLVFHIQSNESGDSVLDQIQQGAEALIGEIFSGAAADLEGAQD